MQAGERAAADSGRDGLVVVHDVPLLAEGGRRGDFDLVVVVDVPAELQVERLVSQRGMAADQARARMAAQATREQRLAAADIVIDNSGSLEDLDRRVAEVWAELESRSRRPDRPAPDRPAQRPVLAPPGARQPRHGEQRPLLGRPVQHVTAAIGEADARSGHQVLDGPRDQDLRLPRERRDPIGDLD